MLVLFKRNPRSMITAFLASRVHNAKPLQASRGRQFYFEETIDADEIEYDPLYSEFRDRFGGLDFLEDEKLYGIVEDEIFWASRYESRDRFNLIFGVLAQIEQHGTRDYLAQKTAESKEMKDRVRRVTGEFRRAKGNIPFDEDRKNGILIGKASFEHDIIDLVLRHYASRKPGNTIVILDREHAHICYEDEILIDERSKFPEKITRKDSKRYWSMLSDPKHIESMKDPAYRDILLPGNYWKWVTEGQEEGASGQMITLDDF